MKAEKKRVGIKAQIRAEKERSRRVATAIFLAIILASAALSAYFGYTILNSSTPPSSIGPTLQFKPENPNPKLKAAIVDQLSLTFPNQVFVQTVAGILKQADYTVDYYSEEKVTVDFFRNLPTLAYGILVLRVHSTATGSGVAEQQEIPVVLFTSELYSITKHVSEQLANQVFQASYIEQEPPYYFAVGPQFIASCTEGRFQNTLVVMMGCEGLSNTWMAQAFMEKGARSYISWDGPVSTDHTDQTTTKLLKHLVTDDQTIQQAVESTMKEVGPDPACNNTLEYYPLKSGSYAIQG